MAKHDADVRNAVILLALTALGLGLVATLAYISL
ncbi:hypothetical protein N566_24825 [Streptomycetaceae bacterium MP113-05]|nr:hypothetical protein N566_24825 [Streptomycetaceae bacterium MP113-05]